MSDAIFLIDNNKQLIELRSEPYDSEDLLQRLLAEHPDVLAGDQVNRTTPRRWLLITREAGIPDSIEASDRWSVDHLFLDQDAVPTLVEVKRSSDTRIRREVVGQMLDYAANAVAYWGDKRLYDQFVSGCTARSIDPDEELLGCLGIEDPADFWSRAKTNLQAGRVRLVFVADEIPPELKRIIEFLNGQMDPAEVIGIEVRQFTDRRGGSSVKALVPTLIGRTAEADQRKGSVARERRRWDAASLYEALGKTSPKSVETARRLEEWARRNDLDIYWGDGALVGSFIPTVAHGGMRYQLFSVRTNGFVELEFGYLRPKPPFDSREVRLELLRRINLVEGVNVPEDRIDRFPSISIEALGSEQALASFLSAYDWAVGEIRRA